MDKTILVIPRMSEKAYGQSQALRTYIFDVPKSANRQTVAGAVATQFKATVTGVNITNVKGKAKRTVRKGGRAVAGRQSDVKKAYVTLKDGDSIPIFAAVEESEKKSEKIQDAADKAAEKQEKKLEKETKPKRLLGRHKKETA